MNLINFGKGSLDFLKDLRKRDIITIVAFLFICGLFFKEEIKQLFKEPDKIVKKESSPKVMTDKLPKKDTFKISVMPDIVRNYLNDEELQYRLDELVEKYNCIYVSVNLFHNTDTALGGYHFKKMTREFEGVQEGKVEIGHNFRGWTIKPFRKLFKKADKKGYFYVKDAKKYNHKYLSKFLGYYNCQSALYVALYDERVVDYEGKPHFRAFMTFEFDHVTDFTEEEISNMIKERYRIEELIFQKK